MVNYFNINKKRKLVYNIGINDAEYRVKISVECPRVNGKRKSKVIFECPFYSVWKSMLERCFSLKFKQKHPTYKDITCCEEWLTFSNFKSWMEQQDWRGKHLDKDLLVYKNKVYSPETCVFITGNINSFITKRQGSRGDYPLGVSYKEKSNDMVNERFNCYRASISMGGYSKYLGNFSTIEEAHKAWQLAKISKAIRLQSGQNKKVTTGLQRVIDKIQHDYDNNLITEDF